MLKTAGRGAAAILLCLAGALALQAQEPGKVPRIGVLITGALEMPETKASLDAFRQGLRDHGYVEGRNILIEYRAADGNIERLPGLAAELARLKVDLIVAGATPAGRAARAATATIPIIVMAMGDPVGDGLVASLARPGGNLTGTTFLGPTLVPKHLALLTEALPRATRIAILWHPGAFADSTMRDMLKEAEAAARTLPSSRARCFLPNAQRVAGVSRRVPRYGVFNNREAVELGALMSYGTSLPELLRRTGTYIDKTLKGARPADLPVEQPTKFELVINLTAAKALGVTIPQSLLLRADQIIN
ncbi:MAG TPA: ABC transporter substrate-binding protein [Methylomirabilota bacterium]|nr:ABC transporter substrate-binding protein [Methylomirabilota bacterium]